MLPQYFCLRQGAKYVGLREFNKSYVVGFRSALQARHVQYTMHPEAQPHLIRNNGMLDVTSDVGIGLRQLSMRRELQSPVLLEPGAHLVIPKAPENMPPHLQDGGYHVLTMEGEDFLTMPLTRHVGLIITGDIIDENKKNITILCDVVEPQFDSKLFMT